MTTDCDSIDGLLHYFFVQGMYLRAGYPCLKVWKTWGCYDGVLSDFHSFRKFIGWVGLHSTDHYYSNTFKCLPTFFTLNTCHINIDRQFKHTFKFCNGRILKHLDVLLSINYTPQPFSMGLSEEIQEAIHHFKDFRRKEKSPPGLSPSELAPFVDHTLLKPDATATDIQNLCAEAIQHNFKGVCVNSSWIPLCRQLLSSANSSCIPIAVVGFPLGAGLSVSKASEARMAIEKGAQEIDMVLPIGRLRGKEYNYVYNDVKSVYDVCRDVPLKVILETSMLTCEEIVAACVICKEIGVAFVKTSTGFGGGGAKVEDVQLMKAVVGEGIEVKASGGIRTYEDAVRMFNAGARRIGASGSVAIVTQML